MRVRLRPRRAGSLVEVLLVCALLVGLAVWLAPRYLGGGRNTSNKALSPTQRARQTEGVSYVVQIRQAIQMYRMDHDDQFPQSLQDLRAYGVTEAMMKDPVSGFPLSYDPRTGEVSGTSTPNAMKTRDSALSESTGD